MSSVSQSKPMRASNRVANKSPSDSQVPNEGWPALRVRLTGLVFIDRCSWVGTSESKRVARRSVSSVSNGCPRRKPQLSSRDRGRTSDYFAFDAKWALKSSISAVRAYSLVVSR